MPRIQCDSEQEMQKPTIHSPAITIVTVTHNDSVNLESTILSVSTQSLIDYEYIIIDANSTDETHLVLNRQFDNRMRILSEPDLGIYDAMNKAIGMSQGEYLLFLNSGDLFFQNDILEKFVNFQRKEDFIYGDTIFRFSTKSNLDQYPDELSPAFFYRYTICQQSVFYHRKAFKKYGRFDLKYRLAADYQHLMRMHFSKTCISRRLPHTVSIYLGDGISARNRVLLQKERRRARRSMFKSAPAFFALIWESIRARTYSTSRQKWKNIIKKIAQFLVRPVTKNKLLITSPYRIATNRSRPEK